MEREEAKKPPKPAQKARDLTERKADPPSPIMKLQYTACVMWGVLGSLSPMASPTTSSPA